MLFDQEQLSESILISNEEKWISDLMDQKLQATDLQDGFVFLQLLSVIAPEHVDVVGHISGTPNMTFWHAVYSILESNPALAAWVHWPEWKCQVQDIIEIHKDGKSKGNVKASISRILEHFYQFMKSNNYAFPSQKRCADDERNMEVLDPLSLANKDPNFLHGLLCLLSYCKEIVHEESKAFQELSELLVVLDFECESLPENFFQVLKMGHMYNLVVNQLYPKSISLPVISSLYQEPPSYEYKAILKSENSALEGDGNHDTLDDQIEICTQLLQHYQQQITPALFPQLHQLLKTIPGYTPQLHTPFDLEDGYLVLLSLISQEMQDFSDLFIDLEQASYWEHFQNYFQNKSYPLPPEFQSDSGRLITICMLSRMLVAFLAKGKGKMSKKIRIKKTRLKLIDPVPHISASSDSAISIQSTLLKASRPSTSDVVSISDEVSEPPQPSIFLQPSDEALEPYTDVLAIISMYSETAEPPIAADTEESDGSPRIINLSPSPRPPSPVLLFSAPSTPEPRTEPITHFQNPSEVSPSEEGASDEEKEDTSSSHASEVMVFPNDSFRPGKPKPSLRVSKSSLMEVVGKSEFTSNQSISQEEMDKSKSDQKPHDDMLPFRQISKKCNKKLIVNALQICLAGTVNATNRETVLETLSNSTAEHFVILLKGAKHHGFKGLYVQHVGQPAASKISKLCGIGPKEISEDDVEEFFKYDSGSRSFKQVPTKAFSSFIHGVSLSRLGSAKSIESK